MTPQQDGLLLTATAFSRVGFRQSVSGVLSSPRRLFRMILLLLALGAVIAVVAYTGEWFGAELPRFEAWIRSLGWWGPLAYVLVFTVLTFLQLPEMLLAVAAGVAFGLWEGTLIVAFANIFAASLGFFIFRSLLKQRLERLLLRYPKAAAWRHCDGHARLCRGWGIPNCALTFSRVRVRTAAINLVNSFVLTWVSIV